MNLITCFRNFAVLLAVCGGAAEETAAGQSPTAPSADMVLLGGKILTLDPVNRVLQAVAIRDARIMAVGSDAEVARHVGPATKTWRLEGRSARSSR